VGVVQCAGIVAAFRATRSPSSARYPSGAGLLEYVSSGFGPGHMTGTTAWLVYIANAIVTAMCAASFGSYASSVFAGGSAAWVKGFAVIVIVVMTLVNVIGSKLVARLQSAIVFVVVGILLFFAVVTIINMDPHLLAPSGYPPARDILSSVALTFFAFLGFGIVTFTAKDLKNPSRELPKAMYLALGLATIVYVAVSIGVFGTLTVQEVIDSGGTAIAKAAEPVLGRAGYWLMTITALFATAGATNGGLYPAQGLTEQLAKTRQFPGFMGRRWGGRYPAGLMIVAIICIALAAGFNLDAIASIGSAVALIIFSVVTIGHFRVRKETGAKTFMLVLALATASVALISFIVNELIYDHTSLIAMIVIILLSIGVELWWARKRVRSAGRAPPRRPTVRPSIQ
jgi:amino acid transporter